VSAPALCLIVIGVVLVIAVVLAMLDSGGSV
jgi:preprotein translocase subunit SecE